MVRRTGVAAVTVLALMILGCRKEPSAPPAPGPPEVSVLEVRPRAVAVRYEFVGMTQASRTVEVRARVAGFLLERAFEEGTAVEEGALLFRIDPRSYEADLEIARARVAQAGARASLAQDEVARYQAGVEARAASQRELDQATTQLADARAAVNLARAELEKAELNLSYTRIMSPVTGMIGRTMKDEGSYLDAGTDSLLAVASRTDPMYVTFSVSEREWLRWREQVASGAIRPASGVVYDPVHPQNPVRITLLDGTPYEREGLLNFIDTTVNSETGSAALRATFPNPEGRLKPGQFVRVEILGWERPGAVLVPQRAVMQSSAGASVMVVGAGDVVEMRQVAADAWEGDDWLIGAGLAAGDRVIVDGLVRARPGSPVKPVPLVEEEGGEGTGAGSGVGAGGGGRP